jgi:hypothetical protein
MQIKLFPKDKWGRIPSIQIGKFGAVWEWPTGKMLWFFWDYGGQRMYRIGPLTIHIG